MPRTFPMSAMAIWLLTAATLAAAEPTVDVRDPRCRARRQDALHRADPDGHRPLRGCRRRHGADAKRRLPLGHDRLS